jgi:DNA repair exonuclease SbcCD ATPase subunit
MVDFETLLLSYDKKISEIDGKINSKANKITEKNNKINELNTDRDENVLKKAILLEACKTMRETSSDIFASISTSAVQTILGDTNVVKIVHGERNGVPTSDFRICSMYNGYMTELEPTDEESGGGVADIVSLANFLTMNILNQEQNSAPILLDEPTKFVSLGHADNVGKFLKKIAEEFDKQIILVTHASDTAKYADKIFHVELDEEGKSVVTELQ